MTQAEKYTYMTATPIPRLMFSLSLPTIISMLISAFYNMADTFFVGQINSPAVSGGDGTSASAAVGVSFSVMAVIQAMGFFFGHGSGNSISRLLGKQEPDKASAMAANGFFLALISGLVISVPGLIFLEPLMKAIGSTPTILPYAKSYMRIILIGAPIMMGSLVLNNQLRFQGSSLYGMLGITSGAILNIILDPLLIFVLDMGIAGAAVATVVSQAVSCCILLIMTYRSSNIAVRITSFRPTAYYIKEIFRGGLPSLFRQGVASVGIAFLNIAAKPYGDAAIAAMSIVSKVSNFANSALIGWGQGFQPICAFNYGAKLYSRVKASFFFSVKCAVALLLVVSAACFAFAPTIISLFLKQQDVIDIGGLALRMICLFFPLNAWIVMCNMMLQSVAKTFSASLLAIARQGLFYIPLLWILSGTFGLFGIQITQAVSDLATFVLSLFLGLSFLKELGRPDGQ